MNRLLLIEDDVRQAELLQSFLAGAGFELQACHTAGEGLRRLTAEAFDALLLDAMLPDGDGFEICRQVRAGSTIPIIMLTARGDELDRIVGLELGADDYLPKPFNPRELLARLKAVLRRGRPSANASSLLRFGQLEISPEERLARLDGEPLALTGYQFDLLLLLARHAGRVMSRDALMDGLRGHELEAFDRSIDVHISRIRAQIEADPKHPRRIVTLRGAGYLFAREQS